MRVVLARGQGKLVALPGQKREGVSRARGREGRRGWKENEQQNRTEMQRAVQLRHGDEAPKFGPQSCSRARWAVVQLAARQRATITAGSEFTSPSHLGGTQDRKRRTARAADVFRLTSTNMITPLLSFSFIPSSSVPLRPRATRPARSNKKFLHAAIQTRGAQESRAQDQCICI